MVLAELARRGITRDSLSSLWKLSFLRTFERVFHEPYFILYGGGSFRVIFLGLYEPEKVWKFVEFQGQILTCESLFTARYTRS